MINERQQKILEILEQKGEVQLHLLKDFLPDVSVMTLRRDLISLENEGHAIRTHGGAVSTKKVASINGEEDAYSRRATENIEAKMKIAEKASYLIENGRSIYFDAGSTLMYLARMLPDENYSIITSGMNIALELLKKQNISVVVPGGAINRNTLSVSGPNALLLLDTVNIDIAFMSASGYSLDSGLTVSNVYECELKKKIINRAKKVVLLLDTEKIDKNMTFTYGILKDIDIWISEKPLPPRINAEAKRYGVQVM